MAKLNAYVALLRGINVGGKNKLPMKELVALFSESGCSDVQTYIQSGNVVFHAGASLAKRVPKKLQAAIHASFGFEVPVILRDAKQFLAVAKKHPLAQAKDDPKILSVGFLSGKPLKSNLDQLEPDRSPPDRFVVKGQDVFFRFPNGIARTKLTSQYFDSRLKMVITIRNWNSVQKLSGMLLE